jgi:hypothetical protein
MSQNLQELEQLWIGLKFVGPYMWAVLAAIMSGLVLVGGWLGVLGTRFLTFFLEFLKTMKEMGVTVKLLVTEVSEIKTSVANISTIVDQHENRFDLVEQNVKGHERRLEKVEDKVFV